MCVAIAKEINPDIKVIREANPDVLSDLAKQENILICDVGRGEYDHHQTDALTKEDGTKYCAAGHLYKDFGHLLPMNEDMRKELFEPMMDFVDRHDNYGNFDPISNIFGVFNPTWDDPENKMDENFFVAEKHVEKLLESLNQEQEISTELNVMVFLSENDFDRNMGESLIMMHFAKCHPESFKDMMHDFQNYYSHNIESKEKSESLVIKEVMKTLEEKNSVAVVTLPQFMPWQDVLTKLGSVYCIYPSIRGGYNIQCVPNHDHNWHGIRIPLPESMTEEKGNIFRHNSGFIGSFETKEQAENFAEQVVKEKFENNQDGFKTYADVFIGKDACTNEVFLQELRVAVFAYVNQEALQKKLCIEDIYNEITKQYPTIKDNQEIDEGIIYSLSSFALEDKNSPKFQQRMSEIRDSMEDSQESLEEMDLDELE